MGDGARHDKPNTIVLGRQVRNSIEVQRMRHKGSVQGNCKSAVLGDIQS